MTIPGLRTAALLSALLLAPFWIGATANAEELPSITVNGAGTVEARPDMAMVSTGAVSQSEQVSAALAQTSEKVAKILALAKALGVAESDVRTEDVSVHPVYEDTRGASRLPAIVGYRASNSVTIRVRKLDRLGDLLDRLSAADADRIGSLRFGVSDPEKLLRQARRRAVADARARAALYAEAAGVALGRVVHIAETGMSLPVRDRRYLGRKEKAAVPVAPGSLEFGASVTIRFAIGRSG
ncbi:MAG: SIMPL domain-containing protein [Rhodospirillaceae bacterium]|nr:SIMPL domain-containing protein [Rhodospirillaceae bacterium]MDE0616016.1 SIMPL domain-containing protein [Rhodospirillaceae bacterium]